MAGFFVLAKIGLVFDFRMSPRRSQKEDGSLWAIHDPIVEDASSRLLSVVQGSSSDVKLARAVMISTAFSALRMGRMSLRSLRHDTLNENLERLFLRSSVKGIFSPAKMSD
jgi:hypothetical protein